MCKNVKQFDKMTLNILNTSYSPFFSIYLLKVQKYYHLPSKNLSILLNGFNDKLVRNLFMSNNCQIVVKINLLNNNKYKIKLIETKRKKFLQIKNK